MKLTQQWYMPYRFVDSSKAVYKPVWPIPLLSVQWINSWWWTDELSETCRVSWWNKFVKLVLLFSVITKNFVTMHGHINVNMSTGTLASCTIGYFKWAIWICTISNNETITYNKVISLTCLCFKSRKNLNVSNKPLWEMRQVGWY